jgi:hypothetical protein
MTDPQALNPIPADLRGDYNPGDCPTCGQQARVVGWQVHNPFEDTYLPYAAACLNPNCDDNGQPVEIQVPA